MWEWEEQTMDAPPYTFPFPKLSLNRRPFNNVALSLCAYCVPGTRYVGHHLLLCSETLFINREQKR